MLPLALTAMARYQEYSLRPLRLAVLIPKISVGYGFRLLRDFSSIAQTVSNLEILLHKYGTGVNDPTVLADAFRR